MENTEQAATGNEPPKQYPAIDKVCEELKEFLRALEPPEDAVRHFRNARIEVLKGFRELIDRRIEHLSRPVQRGQKITVE
ncbi:MAG TPA: hypothetical protein VMG40_06030 [Bryobacteraceae bacterium]|nr:hypothetical protein [Bryobacteraceae bacterium]